MKTYNKSPSADHLENVIFPAVEAELQRIRAREMKSGRSRTPTLRGKRTSLQQFVDTPTSPLGPVETRVREMWLWGQLGWVAGFIDGDGCISAVTQTHRNRRYPSVRIRIDISQNHHGVLKRIQDVLNCGGHLNLTKRNSSQNRDCYQLGYDGRHAVEVLMKLRDLLVRKKAEAEACLHLFIDGQLSRMPGPKGLAPEIIEIRNGWVERIKSLK